MKVNSGLKLIKLFMNSKNNHHCHEWTGVENPVTHTFRPEQRGSDKADGIKEDKYDASRRHITQ